MIKHIEGLPLPKSMGDTAIFSACERLRDQVVSGEFGREDYLQIVASINKRDHDQWVSCNV